MRIAIVNWSDRLVGGAERYLQEIMPRLRAAGHEVAFWCEGGSPPDRPSIRVPDDTPTWNTAAMGVDAAGAELSNWSPDVLCCHGLRDPRMEARVLEIAPAVFFAHAYYGTCVGGPKAHRLPVARPCRKRFGPTCLLHYYPRRCGGLNPWTAAAAYARQRARLQLLQRYRVVVTHSAHLREEYLAHGLAPHRVHQITYLVSDAGAQPSGATGRRAGPDGLSAPTMTGRPFAPPWCLLFVGRMDRLKGGALFVDALPRICQRMGPVHALFVGDGPMRAAWERRAHSLPAQLPVTAEFTGWLSGAELESTVRRGHLLVVPSIWPEPFGRVGPEIGRWGIPAAAFDVGGISQWLTDGANGALAHGDPPTVRGLADAVGRCLANGATYRTLSEGAARLAMRFSAEQHLRELLPILERAARE